MKSLLGKLGVILIGLAIFGNAEVWRADWKFVGKTPDYSLYYDAQSIIRPSKNIVRAWQKRYGAKKVYLKKRLEEIQIWGIALCYTK